ncbi:MAG: HNH endonuclease [Deltaproteobacteria bacterium]|nr:HNH endonuclease [Deltaproteobacteria bacterium]
MYTNYGIHGARGAWHIEHSRALARGGTNHGNNLMAAHIRCNLRKGTSSTRSARAEHGKRKKPMSFEQRERALTRNTAVGAAAGTAIGAVVAGPPGALVGMLLGAAMGARREPSDE